MTMMKLDRISPLLLLHTAAMLLTSACVQAQTGGQRHLEDDAVAAEAALVAIQRGDAPEMIYDAFNEFARTHFGAETDPLIYERFGDELELIEEGKWSHISENSAALAWETNLPAESYVEYGPTANYGQQTETTDRPYYLHVHHVTGLDPGRTYHYRFVGVDERGNRLNGPDQTMTPRKVEGAIYIPGEMDGPPYVLDQAETTYILTEDITAVGTGIIIGRLNDKITLDLNGHTVTFADGAEEGASGVFGIDSQLVTNFRIVNGTIRQGTGEALSRNKAPLDFNPLRLVGRNFEAAGLNIVYHAPQAWGVRLDRYLGEIDIHHNIVKDMGANVTNRHGAASRAIGGRDGKDEMRDIAIHHNLVKRARQNGISTAYNNYRNEIYIDSWSTNSFAIQAASGRGNMYENRVFATGFNPFGFGWGGEAGLNVYGNFVSMFGLDTTHRWHEDWGDINMLAAMRITNYGQGGQKRENLHYWDNLIIMRGKGGSQLQGTRFYTDETVKNTVFRDNVVKVEVLDAQTTKAAPIVGQGHFRKLDSLPAYYRDNRLISNNTLVQFGSPYGKGNNHHLIRNRYEKIGDNPDFATFTFGGGFWTTGHVVLDGDFGPGTAYDDVYWRRTGTQSYYNVAWTLSLTANPGAEVSVTDKDAEVVFTGTVGDDGSLDIPLIQCEIRPVEWRDPDSGEESGKLEAQRDHQKILKTPHTVTVTVTDGDGELTREVEMTQKRSLELR